MSKTRNLGNLTDLITAGATYVTGTTPSQFDNSGNLSTTAFTQRAIGSYSGATNYSSAGGLTLTVANVGQLVNLAVGYSGTVLLPLSSSLTNGVSITIYNGSGNSVTVQRQGSDTIYANNSSATSIAISVGDSAQLVLIGSAWVVWGGAAQLPYSNLFSSTLSTSGYQKLPSGLIMQWFIGNGSASGPAAISFPIAFTSACYSVALTAINAAAYSAEASAAATTTGVNVDVWAIGSTPSRSTAAFYAIVLGK